MKTIIATIIILLSYCSIQAQNAILKGQVLSNEQEPLSGALVELESSSIAVLTDEEGKYQLTLEKEGSYTLVFSYLGFKKLRIEEVLCNEAKTRELNVALELLDCCGEEPIVVTEKKVQSTQEKEQLNSTFFEENAQGTFSKSIEKIAGINAINVGVGIAKPVIRGLSFNRIVVNNNGIKQEGQQWGADHGLEVDQFGVERVELVKGAASLRYGSDALGGAINILPSKILAKNTLKASLIGLYKSNNQHGGFSAYIGGRFSDYFFEARVSYQDFADYRIPTDSFVYNDYVLPIYNYQLKNTAGKERNIKATLGLVKDWGISRLTFSQYYLNAGIFSGAVGIPRSYALEVDGDDRDLDHPSQKVSHISLIWNNDFYIQQHRLQINIGYQNNSRKEFSFPHYHQFSPVDSSDVALELGLQTASIAAIFTHRTTKKWENSYGLSTQYQHNKRAGFEFLLPNFQTIRSGIYWISNFKPNKRWLLTAGLRLDYAYNQSDAYQQAVYDRNQEIQYIPKVEELEQHFFNYAASLGFNCEIRPQMLWLRMHLGKSYRVPHPSETVSNGIHHGTFRHEMGTPNLKPEQGYQLELAMDIKWKRLKANGAVFGNYFQQYIYLSPTGKFSPLPEAGQLYQHIQTDAIYTGGELAWEWEPINNFTLKQAYEYVWNLNLKTGLGLPFTPPASILTELRYQWSKIAFFEDIYTQLTYRYSFEQARSDRNELRTPAYHLLDLGVGFKIRVKKQAIHFGLQIQNLLDTAYLNHLSRYRILEIPEQGRNIVLSLKVPLEFSLSSK
ncbi:TonB-dependent receptor [Aureispira anguillae]|nr:TonB-dependent receptor [Aureispira anguillae]